VSDNARTSRVNLGSWTCPSGNVVGAFLDTPHPRVIALYFEWDSPLPLSPADQRYYDTVILPVVHLRVAEWRERPVGRALVIRKEPS
jgi:hypothetical protein